MNNAEFLRKTPLFAACSNKSVKSIAGLARKRQFKSGDEIIEEGSQSTVGFYILIEGTAKVSRGGRHLAEYSPGDYFGEIALLLDDTRRTATVTATSDVTVLAITRWEFKAVLKTHPEIAVDLMGVLAQRLAGTDKVLDS